MPAGRKKKVSKFEEYPGIDWKNLDNPLVRTADSIFTDRINCWSRLRELEQQLQEPVADREVLAQYVETGIRLELCFSELRNFSDRGAFLGKHPFITQASERDRVAELLRTSPTAFLDEFKNIDANITRYRSHVKSRKYTEEQRRREEENLRKYEALKAMYQEILDTTIKK